MDRARAAADASTLRYKENRVLSPLDGMPFGMKDVFETEDMPMQLGSPIFEGYETGWDAACVYFLRRGGAVMIGKTVTTEFAFGNPGPTRNAWDSNRTPGGSSSGSGAAVGAGMVPAATGTQVRGSILRPACYNGAWALKPSWGAINTRGASPHRRVLAIWVFSLVLSPIHGLVLLVVTECWRRCWSSKFKGRASPPQVK